MKISFIQLVALVTLVFLFGYWSAPATVNEELEQRIGNCNYVCVNLIEALSLDPKLKIAFRIARLIPQTELACERMCIAEGALSEAFKAMANNKN